MGGNLIETQPILLVFFAFNRKAKNDGNVS